MAMYFEDPFYEFEEDIEVVEIPKSKAANDTYRAGASVITMNYYQKEAVENGKS